MPRDVTTLTPIACEACAGEGVTETLVGEFVGMNGVVEPVYREDPCVECDRTGEAECAWCCEAVAVVRVSGDPVCAECAEEDL